MKTIHLTSISFPDIKLNTRDAHKLRGYFGSVFQEQSPLLHNHYESGKLRYRYPLVQYKVIRSVPTLLAMEEGAELLATLFLRIKELDIDGKHYTVNSKNIKSEKVDIGYSEELISYSFLTLWMALNQQNYRIYRACDETKKGAMLNKILIGHVLSFYKSMDLRLEREQKLLAKTTVLEKSTAFKNQKMTAFSGDFVINAKLPEMIGLGKSVSRGFGTISTQTKHWVTSARSYNDSITNKS